MVSVNPFRLSVQVMRISLVRHALQVGQDTHPERRAFRFANPHAKNFLQAVLFQSDAKVNGLVYDLAVIPVL